MWRFLLGVPVGSVLTLLVLIVGEHFGAWDSDYWTGV